MRSVQYILLALLFAAPVAAQEPEKGTGPTRVDLKFEGGSLADLCDELRAASGGANIIAAKLASKVEIPELELKQATVQSALKAVTRIVAAPYHVAVDTEFQGWGKEVYSVAVIDTHAVNSTQTSRGARADQNRVAVFSLAQLTSPLATDPKGYEITLSSKTVLMAIEAGLSVTKRPMDSTMRFHEESSLLFLEGTQTQLTMVEETLDHLRTDVRERRNAAIMAEQQKRRASTQPKDN